MIEAHARDGQTYNPDRVVDQFRALATKIFRASRTDGREVKSIAVTACEPEAGVTSTVAKLALAASEQMPRVIALQFERPHNALELMLGFRPAGQSKLAGTHRRGIPARLITRTQSDRILLARIDRNVTHGNQTFKSEEVLQQLLVGKDVLIGDLPPIADDTATLSILSQFDGVLLVVRAEQTRRFDLRRVYDELHRLQTNVVGVVFNNCSD
jgi:Mrp family chromosome partitioning ATPase